MKKYFVLFTLLGIGAGCQNTTILENSPEAILLEKAAASEPAKKVETDMNDLSPVKTVDKFKVTLGSKEKMQSGKETHIYFQIEGKNGAPIEHVDRYYSGGLGGGFGRLTVQKADTGESIQVTLPPKSLTEIYNRIPFNITFPAPGKYKMSFEFKYWGKVYTALYVVEVRE